MKKAVIGVLAHVDAGKTTLSEAMLYESGAIRTKGRVDKGDAFLDTETMEKERGITIFSKQAVFAYADTEFFCWIRQDMWIFRRKWSAPCRYWTMRCWS